VLDAIAGALRMHAQVRLLDIESDADHNRSVFTLVAPPEGIVPALFDAIKTAAALIDLEHHRGAHPRIGAADVVPFVPLRNVEMAECVTLARELGQRVGEELSIPVYLYEAAATRPDRVNLADIRHGEYERLKTEIASSPDRAPDFGPRRLGPAGATVIGARAFLVAYNVFLSTDNVEVARKIARAIRNSSGGLRYVKALGLLVNGKAQVSMNLTDFSKTPIHVAVEMIRREAARYGVGIESSELIGMIPQQALLDAAAWYLQLDNLKPEMVLENRLRE
jgi:glutamate formiminotransferase/formiminotetrahydrofolate cyclodeaminase